MSSEAARMTCSRRRQKKEPDEREFWQSHRSGDWGIVGQGTATLQEEARGVNVQRRSLKRPSTAHWSHVSAPEEALGVLPTLHGGTTTAHDSEIPSFVEGRKGPWELQASAVRVSPHPLVLTGC